MDTKIHTGTNIHTRLMTLELFALNERSVRDPLLKEIIEYCLPRQLLSKIQIRGMKGNDVYATMDVHISYSEDNQVYVKVDSKLRADIDSPEANQKYQACPVWTQTIDWFCRICKENDLRFEWGPKFSRERQSMWIKFGFVARQTPLNYRTNSKVTHKAVNSNAPGLQLATRLSSEILTESNVHKKV